MILCAFGLTGCMTTRRLPAYNLSEEGWIVSHGQAVWHRPDAEITGELLVAINSDGRTLVEFSKPPFPVVMCETSPRYWQAEFPAQNKLYARPGRPPIRLLWFYLPVALSGGALPDRLHWEGDETAFKLALSGTAETIEGFCARLETGGAP